MKKTLFIIFVLTTPIIIRAQLQRDSFIDPRDGKTYKTVKIGNQTWIAENLNYETSKGSWCYNNSSSYCNTYGRLYDWNTARRSCPSGWRLPSKNDFEILLRNVDGSGNNAYHALKDGGSSGFNALFGGWRYDSGGFDIIVRSGYWWSSSEDGTFNAWSLFVNSFSRSAGMGNNGKDYGISVRCIKE